MPNYAPPPWGSLKITSLEDGTFFQCFLGDGSPIVTEGYSGWQVVSRPRDVGITEWAGRNPMAIEIPFLVYRWEEKVSTKPGDDCENDIQNLETLCGIGSHAQPPVCRVDANGIIPHDYTLSKTLSWVVESVGWDRGIEARSDYSGNRMRAGGNITIRQFIAARDILRRINAKSRAVKPKKHKVKRGETLGKIAAFYYGDSNKWKRIADANHMRDRRSLHVGQTLIIPQW